MANLFGATTFSGKVVTFASAAGAAGFNIPSGTAPSSPVNGDVWKTSAGLFVRVEGVTVGPLIGAASPGALGTGTPAAATFTTLTANSTSTLTGLVTATAGVKVGANNYVSFSCSDTQTGYLVSNSANPRQALYFMHNSNAAYNLIVMGTAFSASVNAGAEPTYTSTNEYVNNAMLFIRPSSGFNFCYRAAGAGTFTPTTVASIDTGGSLTLAGDAAVNGGDLTSAADTFNLLCGSHPLTAVNFATACTTVTIGKGAGTINLNAATIDSNQATVALLGTPSSTVNFAGASAAVNIGAATGYVHAKGHLTADKRIYHTKAAITANDTSPDVSGANVFVVPGTWTAGNNITALDNGIEGQVVMILGGDSDCIMTDGSHLKLAGNWTGSAGATITLVYDGTDWWEIGRTAT